MPLKRLYTLPLAVAGLSLLIVTGFSKSSLSQSKLDQISSPEPTVSSTPLATPPSGVKLPTAQSTPGGCLDDPQASLAIAGVLTREQTKQSVALFKQGKKSQEILDALNLTKEQKRSLREIGRQKCKK